MLRASSRQKVIEILEATYFGIDNYSVEFGAEENQVFRIRFVPNPSFYFAMSATDGSSAVWCFEAPGMRFLVAESHGAPSVDSGMNRIGPWAGRIREELVALNPFAKEISGLKAHVDERLAVVSHDVILIKAKARSWRTVGGS